MKKTITFITLTLLVFALTLTMVACDEQGVQGPQGIQGEQGIRGEQGVQGPQGIQGEKGEDGHSPVITIGTNGNWLIDGYDTGVSATGSKGDKGDDGEAGKDGSTWFHGAELIPADTEGLEHGDYFFNTTTLDVYNLIGKTWIKIANLSSTVEPEMVTVNFEVNLPAYMYEFEEYVANSTLIQTQTIEKGSWLTLENFDVRGWDSNLSDYFLGWHIGEGVDETKITSYTSINADCTLTAKWDYDKISETYTSKGVMLELYGNLDNEYYVAGLGRGCGEIVHIGETYRDTPITKAIGINVASDNIKELSLPYSANISGSIAIEDSDYSTSLNKVSWRDKAGDGEMVTPAASYIGVRSFEGCSSLEDVQIPDSIKSIHNLAFKDCTSLKSFDCEYTKAIGDNAFRGCTSLENVTMWYVEEIGEYAFYNCSSLKYSTVFNISFYITERVKVVGNNAFEGCLSLIEIYINSAEIANLTNNDSCLFSYVEVVKIKKEIATDTTAYLDDSQGKFVRTITDPLATHDELRKVEQE